MRHWPPRASALRLVPWLLALPVALPLVAGLVGTALPAFGALPGLARAGAFAAWRELLAWPGLRGSLLLTLRVGLGATLLATGSALVLAIAARRVRVLAWLQPASAPLLAVPHAATAAGLAFLIAPSGWLARLFSPWLTGWRSPPDIAIVHDPAGLAMLAGLWLKETPFLLVVTLAALGPLAPRAALRAAATLGHGPWRAWLLVLLPRLWPRLRLPVMAVLVFSLSTADIALVLGPSAPPPLAVQLLRWFDDPDLARWPVACAGALLLVGLAALCCGVLLLLEVAAGRLGRAMIRAGACRGRPARAPMLDAAADRAAEALAVLLLLVAFGALAATCLWAGAGGWGFAHALPTGWAASRLAARWAALGVPAVNTLALAAAATLLALACAVAGLQAARRPPGWLLLPLLVPQPALLWGQQVLLVRAGLDGTWLALIWSHLQFVLPYVLLMLREPFRVLDRRHARAAAGLGAGPWRVLWRITLPLLARPLLAAGAIGVAVSTGLYLPTLFASDGRVETLATLTVALASGPDRRLAAAAALAQAALPCLALGLAVLLPALAARRRRGLAIAG